MAFPAVPIASNCPCAGQSSRPQTLGLVGLGEPKTPPEVIIIASVLDPVPRLFERVPRGLFGPLGDPYAELYWELLATLYRCEFEREPFLVLRSVAIEIAEQAIRTSNLWATRRGELEAFAREEDSTANAQDETAVVRALARRLTARLERSGWIHFQYRAGQGEIMSFHPYAARIAETLLRVARDDQPAFQGLVHSIAALLDPRAFAQRPGVSLMEAKRNTLELSRELKILERNIHLFTQRCSMKRIPRLPCSPKGLTGMSTPFSQIIIG